MPQGAFRTVWFIEKWAIKIPRSPEGLKANQREVAKWRSIGNTIFDYPGGNIRLCPIVFSLPFGFAVVMRRAKLLPPNYFADLKTFTRTQFLFHTVRQNIMDTDYLKASNYGFLDGTLVVLDYAGLDGTENGIMVKVKYDTKDWGRW
jgi:hypothetical protein